MTDGLIKDICVGSMHWPKKAPTSNLQTFLQFIFEVKFHLMLVLLVDLLTTPLPYFFFLTRNFISICTSQDGFAEAYFDPDPLCPA